MVAGSLDFGASTTYTISNVAVSGLAGPSTSVSLMAEYGPSSQGLPDDAQQWVEFASGTYAVTYTPPGGTPTADPVVAMDLENPGWDVVLTLADPVANGSTLQVVAPGTNPSPAEAGEFPAPVSNEIIVSPSGSIPSSMEQTTNPITFTVPGPTPATSANWSGDALDNGPFSGVTGSFQVPYLTVEATCDEMTSEWVGIDGLNNSSLIQAGVSESMTDPYTGECEAGTFYTWAWWEVLPADSTPITAWTSGTAAIVNAGDTVTVTIEANGSISLVDNNALVEGTNDGVFTTQQLYSGPATSVEWVVEAPASTTLCGGLCTLAPYSDPSGSQPGVTFGALGATGSEADLYQITMVQGGDTVSTPSALGASSFDVDYTGAFESRMGTTDAPMHDLGATGTKLLYPTSG